MARAKSSKRKSSRPTRREAGSAEFVTGSQKVHSARTASDALVAPQPPLFTTSIQLGELGKAIPRIDLFPLSSFGALGSRIGQNFQSPAGNTAPFLSFAPQQQKPVVSVETLGALVRAYREEFELTQQSFAERAGVGRRFVSELENGKPSLEFDKVLAVARAAGIDLFAVRKTSVVR
jgi:y4mF family transcriptional regulator